MASLVIEGDLGFAQLVGAVSYYDREIENMADATTYTHYWAANYCHDATYYSQADYPYYFANPDTNNIVWWGTYCGGETVEGDYLSVYYEPVNEDKLTAEIRLQGGGDVLEWLVGGYYEESNDDWFDPFHAPTPGGRVDDQFAASNYANSISRQFNEFYYGGDWSNTTSNWSAGQKTSWEQKAIFGEMTWHINDSWDLTVGGRYFDRSSDLEYWANSPGRLYHDEGRFTSDEEYREENEYYGYPPTQVGEDTQFIPKVAVSYHLSEDTMMYALYTEGVRQGGANRGRGDPFFPKSFESDLMKNYEVGYRSSFADGKGRLNLTLYHMAWEEYQLQVLDPSFVNCIDPATGEEVPPIELKIPGVCGQPWQTVIANLGDAHITGANVTVDYAPNDNWVLGFNYEKMEAETDSDHNLNDDPGPGDRKVDGGCRSPRTTRQRRGPSITGRPDCWVLMISSSACSGRLPVRASAGSSHFRLTNRPRNIVNPAYNIGDLRAGLVGDTWQVDVFVNNLTDERAIYTYVLPVPRLCGRPGRSRKAGRTTRTHMSIGRGNSV